MFAKTVLHRRSMRRAVLPVLLTSGRCARATISRAWFATTPTWHQKAHASASASPARTAASLTSPQGPLANIFCAVNANPKGAQVTPGGLSSSVVLHTGYKVNAGNDASATTHHNAAAVSYEVTDTAAFEQLINEAVQVTPARVTTTAPGKTAEAAQGKSASSSASQKNAEDVTSTLLINHTVRELQALLAETEKALETPASRKEEIDRYVYKVYMPLLKYGTFALLAVQFVVYFNWIFFVFDWNLVEPTTYFLGYTGVFCSLVYHYYRCGEDDFTWKNLFRHLAHREAEKMYFEKKVDAEAVAQLQQRVAAIKAELARVTV